MNQLEPNVEVVRQPRRPDLTYLPPALVEAFAARDQQLGLRQRSADTLAMDATIGWRPVEVDGMSEEIQGELRAAFEIRQGHAFRGDCVLAARSFAARDDQTERMEELRRSQLDDHGWVEGVEDSLQAIARSTGRSTGRSLLVGNVPYLRDQVLGGEKLQPIVADELRRAERRTRGGNR